MAAMKRSRTTTAGSRLAKIRAARERIASELDAMLAERRDAELLDALRDLARRSGGVGRVAERAGVNRTFLYRMLSPSGNPEMRTIDAVLRTMGLRVGVRAMLRGRGNGRGSAAKPPRVFADRARDRTIVAQGPRREPKRTRRTPG
jgi:probable addiction module antidote protein